MNRDSPGQSIHPAEFQSPEQLDQRAARTTGSPASLSLLAIGFVGVLLLLALATLFYLPDQVVQPSVGIGSDTSPVDVEVLEQPFSDAQLLRARREAQEILADLVVAQNQLEELSVEEWAAQPYADILQLAGSGDLAYQERDFESALQSYRGALDSAESLLDQRHIYASNAVTVADQAFIEGDSQAALTNYSLALRLAPENELAQLGMNRARVLDQVNQLKEEAAALTLDQNWNAAQERLQRATELDPEDADAAAKLTVVEEQIRQKDFRETLAEGFNALANADYAQARSAFLEADQLIPDHPTVADAMLQVDSAAETRERGDLLEQARIAESNEDWTQAVQEYQELLARDAGFVEARVGLIRAQARAELAQKIEAILLAPLSLQSDENWNAAERVLADARAIVDKTPDLTQQIVDLERVIQQARTPVELQLLSDGQTNIEIYRVGQLGTLREHRVNIYPGEYVVIGRRSGFRDIRKEIAITGEAQTMAVRVEAVEPIN